MPRILLAFLALYAAGCAHHAIRGQVLDRNGQPMDRVIVSLDPGNVELITDAEGRFEIDYLRDESGQRVRLSRRQDYQIEAFRAGFHPATAQVHYRRGELVLDPLTLTEDTIRLRPSEVNIDPARFPDRAHSAGTNYEGE